MRVVEARNVNDAYVYGIDLLKQEGIQAESRAGSVLVAPWPVTTVYERPYERVLLDPTRDANPFFHLFEALWMLSGSNDARWLDRFVGDFSARFSEGGIQHGAYGFRWRRQFGVDQLAVAAELLRKNPEDRRVVIQMWSTEADLGADKKDVPCNLIVLPRIRLAGHNGDTLARVPTLDITVFCRSNDAVWGAYGANAVHFSVMQEVLAAYTNSQIGRYYQISNNFHIYTDMLGKATPKLRNQNAFYDQHQPTPLVTDKASWDDDLRKFMHWSNDRQRAPRLFNNEWFENTAVPLFEAHSLWKLKAREAAVQLLEGAVQMSPDWRTAAYEWFKRRLDKVKE